MDMWKFYDITHREHVICNPTSEEKLGHLVEQLRLPAGARVIDIACGKGEFLIRLAEAYGVNCLGIDLSPFFIADARKRLEVRAPKAEVAFREMDGAEFEPDGTSQLHRGVLSWRQLDLRGACRDPGCSDTHGRAQAAGWSRASRIWLQEPCEEYLQGPWPSEGGVRDPRRQCRGGGETGA